MCCHADAMIWFDVVAIALCSMNMHNLKFKVTRINYSNRYNEDIF